MALSRAEGRLRGAVIGAGRIGAGFDVPGSGSVLTHAGAYRASSRTQLVGICDLRADVAAACGRLWGVPAFADVDEMLAAAEPEIVSICTPDETHAEIAARVVAAASVRGILMEKPLALSLADAERTVAAASRRGITLAVNYSRRWAHGIQRVGQLLRSGRLGAVRTITGHYANGWLHNGTHWIDLARLLIGEVSRVRALHAIDSSVDGPLDAELAFANGARGVVLGHAGVGLSFFEMDIVCQRGRVRLVAGAEQIEVFELRPSPTYATFVAYAPTEAFAGGLAHAMLQAVDDTAECVAAGAVPACTGHDALQALRVAEAARKSEQAWVTIGGAE